MSIINSNLQITVDDLNSGSWYDVNKKYNIRKKLNKANSINVPLKFDNITSDVTNVYFDEDSGYAASNSLPSKVNSNLPNIPFFENIDFELNKVTLASNGLQELNNDNNKYKLIKVAESDIKLLTGDRVYYESTGATFNTIGVGETISSVGIDTGSYFIEVVSASEQLVKLYSSRSFIQSGTGLELDYPKDNNGNIITETHTFTLYSQRSKTVQPTKSLKKFPIEPNLKKGGQDETIPGTRG